jgi:hypothetical protein
MRNKDLVKIISITLALVSLFTCLFIWGELSGFEKGYFYGFIQNPPHIEGISGNDGTNFYQIINITYFIISIGFCAYVTGKFLKSSVISNIVCMASLSIVTYPLFNILLYKNDFLPVKGPGSHVFWRNISIYFDCFFLFATVILLLIEIILINTRKLSTETLKIS